MKKVLFYVFSAIYFPIFITGKLLLRILNFLMAIPYIMVGDLKMSVNLIKYAFYYEKRKKRNR